MANSRKTASILVPFILAFTIGSLLLGVRFGRRFLEKKLLAAFNTKILKTLSSQLTWENVRTDLLRNTLTFENVSVSSHHLSVPLSVKKVQVRYSLVNLFRSGRLFFPRIRLVGLEGKWTAGTSQEGTPQIPLNEELVRIILEKAPAFFRKVQVLDGDWQVDFPAAGRHIHFQQIELRGEFSKKNSLSVWMRVPRMRVIGPGEGSAQNEESFSLPQAAFCLFQNSLRLDAFSLSTSPQAEEVELQGEISHLFDSSSPALDLSYHGRMSWKRLKARYPHLDFQGSPLVARGKIGGTVEYPILKGKMEVEEIRFGQRGTKNPGTSNQPSDQPLFAALKVNSRYLLEKDRIVLSQLSFSTLSGKVSGQAEFDFPDQGFSITASLDGLRLPPLCPSGHDQKFFLSKAYSAIQKAYPLCGGTVAFQGKLLGNRQPIGSGKCDIRFDGIAGRSMQDPLTLKSESSLLQGGTIRFDSSSLKLAGNSLDFYGKVNYSGAGHFEDLCFDTNLKNSAGLCTLWPALTNTRLRGEIFLTGRIGGSFSDPTVNGSLIWQDAVFEKFSMQKIEGFIRYDQKSIIFSKLHLQQNQTSITVDGKISALTGQGDLHAVADPIYYADLASILKLHAPLLIEGRMACQSDVQILPESEHMFLCRGQVTTGEWSIAHKLHPFLKQHFNSVTSAFTVDGHTFRLDHTVGSHGRQKVFAELIIPYHQSSTDSRYRFTSEDWDLTSLDTVKEPKIPLEGRSSFQVQGTGWLGHGNWTFGVCVQQPRYEGFSLDQVMASMQMHGEEYHGEITAGENKFFVQGTMDKGISYQLVGKVPELHVEPDLPYLCNMLKNMIPFKNPKSGHAPVKDKVLVELSGQVKAQGILNDFKKSSGEFLASKATIYTPLHSFSARQPFTITYDQGRIFVSDSFFTGEEVKARLSGEISRDRRLDFSFSGVIPMNYLGQKCTFLAGSTGKVQFDLSLDGSPGSLQLSSRLRAIDCSFDLPRVNRRIEAVQGDIIIDEHTITIANLTGMCHEGRISLSGKADWRNFEITSVDLNLKGENILLADPLRYKFIMDGNLRWQGSKEHSDLDGVIDIREGRYNRDTGLLQELLTRRRKIDIGENSFVQLSGTEWFSNVCYDVRINIPQYVWIRSAFFNVEIAKSNFAIKGNFSHPYPEGQIRTMNGTILLGGSKFRIISGLLELTDPERQNPSLDILAATDIDAYRITANIFGPIDDPQVRLSSTPYLSQTDILNMIALGISSDAGAEGELAGQTSMGGGSSISDIFGKELTSFTGIDLFRAKVLNRDLFRVDLFTFKVGEESGTVENITVGRDITKRLQLKYSIPTSEEKPEIAEADYKLSDYIKLIGSQDDLGTYSLDLNFSFEF
ncbi:MAG: translocation/assembly module TamB domain-containing protein [bacterium]